MDKGLQLGLVAKSLGTGINSPGSRAVSPGGGRNERPTVMLLNGTSPSSWQQEISPSNSRPGSAPRRLPAIPVSEKLSPSKRDDKALDTEGKTRFDLDNISVIDRPIEKLSLAERRKEEDICPIDLEDLLRPMFDAVADEGRKAQEAVMDRLQEWVAGQVGEAEEETKPFVEKHLTKLCARVGDELSQVTGQDKQSHATLYGAVKDAVQEEVTILQKRLKGGSFKVNLSRMVAHAVEEKKEQEIKDTVDRLESEVKELEQKIDALRNTHAKQVSELEHSHAKEVEQKVAERIQKEMQVWKGEKEKIQLDYQRKIKAVTEHNEALTRIVVEMRQHQAKKKGISITHTMEVDLDEVDRVVHGKSTHSVPAHRPKVSRGRPHV
mmetsp:Transcript_25377/g.41756  ORF Transcript_25377/g.41756 Transcript_25377/m.41756 type:complete len:380 (-) Transcript_25377:1241-2380(-)|eukprot:CAMPEP_0184654630 /NCGR_PEP_ID=MMETSP0308-20130426/12301_1 /TAXON_ID=38269 /ORGANISM="Gloeochaete witrockiana, Strain SAG 46.84" /LENGTH=379 /DNA_ID=CAMNT_0027090713 /DNA_START=63 /DNA_END=1202 /DNA_ORIENTATION=+